MTVLANETTDITVVVVPVASFFVVVRGVPCTHEVISAIPARVYKHSRQPGANRSPLFWNFGQNTITRDERKINLTGCASRRCAVNRRKSG